MELEPVCALLTAVRPKALLLFHVLSHCLCYYRPDDILPACDEPHYQCLSKASSLRIFVAEGGRNQPAYSKELQTVRVRSLEGHLEGEGATANFRVFSNFSSANPTP